MSIVDGEVMIKLDALTLVHLKLQQLEMNKPRPDNFGILQEELFSEYQNQKDKLVELLIQRNIINVQEKSIKEMSTDKESVFDAEKINAQIETLNTVHNNAIDEAINVVNNEPVRFAEFDFIPEKILESIISKLNQLKKP